MIDARGLSCPQPVILVKKGLSGSPESAEVLVDNMVSVENIRRFAESAGYHAEFTEQGDEFHVVLRRK